jgi:dihydrofolate synthase/folylpolyglutamate synthase
MTTDIDSLLKPFGRFGVNLGLERIKKLLDRLGNPEEQVPIIHIAGSNGKGSVCAYLSSILTEAGYKVGRYISPHLVDWTERICLNETPIETSELAQLLLYIQKNIDPQTETPTQFEVITAAAWLYFSLVKVDVAVIEVGLGGRLDATNVVSNPLITAIVSISREHWQNLGPTLAHIATEKAGILKFGCPAVIGPLPPQAKSVVEERLAELSCPHVWVEPATYIDSRDDTNRWASYRGIDYPLSLLGEIQLTNSAIAIEIIRILQQQGWSISLDTIQNGMSKTIWLGRLQWTSYNDLNLLIDGAHNPSAAQVLRQYVDTLDKPVIWVMGMLSTKEHADIFQALLRPGDRLYLVPVPDHSSANPETLASLAETLCPELELCQSFSDLFIALKAVSQRHNNEDNLIVLCGSLYLLGYFLKNNSQS